jgi:hypothetical protein
VTADDRIQDDRRYDVLEVETRGFKSPEADYQSATDCPDKNVLVGME